MTEGATYEMVISRIFGAPPELVYRAFTDPDQLARWFGPVGWSVPRETVEIDARPGGRQRFVMVNAENPGLTSAVDAEFTEVIENQLLAGFQDVGHPPGQAGPSGRLTLRLEFYPEAHGSTRLVIRQGPYPEELEILAREGWDTSFTKLDDLLAQPRP